MVTRRDRQRAATVAEIKAAALGQIAAEGPAALSVRGIARAIGMSPAGIYRYYESLDQLVTELVTEAYDELADAVTAAMSPPGPARRRIRAGMLAYRQWSVDDPNRFLLVFGTPIPGYSAPVGGPTEVAARRLGGAFFAVAAEAWAAGELAGPAGAARPERGEVRAAALIGAGFPPPLVGVLLSAWAHFHGLVTLELLGQLDWVYPDPARFYRREVDRLLDGLFAPASPGGAR